MSSVRIAGDTSGTVTLQAPAIAGNPIITLPTTSGTLITDGVGQTFTDANLVNPTLSGAVFSNIGSSMITAGTVQSTSSGTLKSYTGIPSWVKRITVILSGVDTNGANPFQVQIGSGTYQSTGYLSYFGYFGNGTNGTSLTSGFGIWHSGSNDVTYATMTISNLSGNTWVSSHYGGFFNGSTSFGISGGGNVTLSGVLDRVRLATTSTDSFDAGSVNIFYE